MRRLLACAAGAWVLLAAPAALPCGAAFGPSINIDPKQDIILVWKDNLETYVFQPVFCGTSTDFGLILPVAASLSQQPTLTEQQAFTTAAALSEPHKRRVDQHSSVGCGPGSTDSAGSKGADNGTTVVASGRVGILDWVQLKADTVSDFTKWLTDNGYPYSSTSSSVFSYYVEQGWYFLAFRISQEVAPDGQTICRALGPIKLSFPTAVPVIPSRMASAGSSPDGTYRQFAWRVFGITRGDAELGFAGGETVDRVRWYSGAISATDAPSFAGLAEAGDRLTRLALTFYAYATPESTPDVGLALAPPRDYRGTEDVYVYDGSACSLGWDRGSSHVALPLLAGVAIVGLLGWRRRRR